jgi:two-component sensor histidine kinase
MLADGLVSLIVEDDGVGYKPDQQPRGSGLGQKIILAMAQNLRSKIEIDPNHRGTRAMLAFAP